MGELLVEAGLVSPPDLAHALEQQALHGGRLGTRLLMAGLVTEQELSSFLSRQFGLPALHRLDDVEPAAVRMLPRKVALRHQALPVQIRDGRLWVAMADPLDGKALAAVEHACGMPVVAVVAPELVLGYAVRKHYAGRVTHQPDPSAARPRFNRSQVVVFDS